MQDYISLAFPVSSWPVSPLNYRDVRLPLPLTLWELSFLLERLKIVRVPFFCREILFFFFQIFKEVFSFSHWFSDTISTVNLLPSMFLIWVTGWNILFYYFHTDLFQFFSWDGFHPRQHWESRNLPQLWNAGRDSELFGAPSPFRFSSKLICI